MMTKQPRIFHVNGMELGRPSISPGTLQSSNMRLEQDCQVTVPSRGWVHATPAPRAS